MHLELLCELCHCFVHEYCNKNSVNLWKGTKQASKLIQKKTTDVVD